MRYVPTEKQLEEKVKLVEITVAGEYIARIDERRKTSRKYEVKVLVPEKFTKSDVKRATPKVLLEHKDFGDFISMRTFEQRGAPKKTDKTIKRSDLYNMRELTRFTKMRKEYAAHEASERKLRKISRQSGIMVGDTTEYEEETGLPPVVNDDDSEEDAA